MEQRCQGTEDQIIDRGKSSASVVVKRGDVAWEPALDLNRKVEEVRSSYRPRRCQDVLWRAEKSLDIWRIGSWAVTASGTVGGTEDDDALTTAFEQQSASTITLRR